MDNEVNDDKKYITSADINELLRASKKLSLDETKKGSIVKTIIRKTSGEPKIITAFIITDEVEQVNMTGYTQDKAGTKYELTGSINYDSITKARSNHSPVFRLRETFFNSFEKIKKDVKMKLLNSGEIIYYCDEDGKVYFKDLNGDKLYVNESRTGGVDEYGYFYAFEKTDSGIYLIARTEVDTTYFDYLYLTKKAKEEAIRQEELKEEEIVKDYFRPISHSQNLFSKSDSKLDFRKQKVIDFEEYKERIEERGPRR